MDLTKMSDANATVQLCAFNVTLFNSAGRVVPSPAGFTLELEGKKRGKLFPIALTAVRKLRKASKT